ncbi:phage holin family protein [Spirosoma fluminis]
MLERLEEIRENIFRYLEARIELFTLETRGKVEEGVVVGIHGIVLALLATMTTIFVFSLLAAYLNEVTDSRYLGFLIVASFFLVMTLIWVAGKDFFKSKIRVAAYNAIKKSQEKKKEEKSEAVQELMAQTRTSLNESGRYVEQGPTTPKTY